MTDAQTDARAASARGSAANRPVLNRIVLNRIGFADLKRAIGEGVADFAKAAPVDLLFGGLFAAAGWLLIALLAVLRLPYLAYPLAMGFALVAPFAAIAFYAGSDLIDRGERLTLGNVANRMRKGARGDVRWMSLVTGFALVIWMDLAAFIFFAFVGLNGFSIDFVSRLFTTPAGLIFLVVGNAAGALIALCVFSISVISFPLLFDRETDFVTAMATSVRLVRENFLTMLVWCAIIGVAAAVSVATGFIGLLITLPVIGHASWRLYRLAVVPQG